MNLIIVNANTSEKLLFIKNNTGMFSQASSLPEEVFNSITNVHTTPELAEYAKNEYPHLNIVLFQKTSECFRDSGEKSDYRDVIIYVDYGMVGHIINWLTKLVPFNNEIYRA